MKDTLNDLTVSSLYTGGSHHRNFSVITTMQNVYPQGKYIVKERKNTAHIALFNFPIGQALVETLARQMHPRK